MRIRLISNTNFSLQNAKLTNHQIFKTFICCFVVKHLKQPIRILTLTLPFLSLTFTK